MRLFLKISSQFVSAGKQPSMDPADKGETRPVYVLDQISPSRLAASLGSREGRRSGACQTQATGRVGATLAALAIESSRPLT